MHQSIFICWWYGIASYFDKELCFKDSNLSGVDNWKLNHSTSYAPVVIIYLPVPVNWRYSKDGFGWGLYYSCLMIDLLCTLSHTDVNAPFRRIWQMILQTWFSPHWLCVWNSVLSSQLFLPLQDIVVVSGFAVRPSPTVTKDKLHAYTLHLDAAEACVYVRIICGTSYITLFCPDF